MGRVYAYARVSTTEQNYERQVEAIKKYWPEIEDENIFIDKKTGKNFDREEYRLLKRILKKGDALVIQDTDRLGRNKRMVKDELKYFKDKEIRLRILNLPTTLVELKDNDWVMDMVNNILIEVYTSLDEEDYHKRRERQKEGIEIAKRKGIYQGKKRKKVDSAQFERVYTHWREGLVKRNEAMEMLGLKHATFYRRVRDYEIENGIREHEKGEEDE